MKIKMNASSAGWGGCTAPLAIPTTREVFLQNSVSRKGALLRPLIKQLSQKVLFLQVFVKHRSLKKPFLWCLCRTVKPKNNFQLGVFAK